MIIIYRYNFIVATTTPQGVTNLRIKTVNKSQGNQTRSKPTEQTSIGGISVGTKTTGKKKYIFPIYRVIYSLMKT